MKINLVFSFVVIIISRMAKRIKFTRKEIKSPDEFRKSISSIVEIISDNYIKFVIGVGLIIIIIGAIFSVLLS
jgi:uncharacterized membrane protein